MQASFFFADFLKAVHAGDWVRIVLDVLLFLYVGVLVTRAINKLQKSVDNISTTIGVSFQKGDARFGKIEDTQTRFEGRLAILEKKFIEGL